MNKVESVQKYIILFNKNNKTVQVTVEYLTFMMNCSSSSPSSSMIKCSWGRRTFSNTGRNPLLFWNETTPTNFLKEKIHVIQKWILFQRLSSGHNV